MRNMIKNLIIICLVVMSIGSFCFADAVDPGKLPPTGSKLGIIIGCVCAIVVIGCVLFATLHNSKDSPKEEDTSISINENDNNTKND